MNPISIILWWWRLRRVDKRARGLREPLKQATPEQFRRWYLNKAVAMLRRERAVTLDRQKEEEWERFLNAVLPCVYPAPCDCPGCVALGRDVPMVQKGAR